jgi:hypothetical protein
VKAPGILFEVYTSLDLLFIFRMPELFRDQAFVEAVVTTIVNHPEDVRTVRSVDSQGVLITLSVHQDDMKHVIGKKGQTAQAIRTLLKTVGARDGLRVCLLLDDPRAKLDLHTALGNI